MEIIAFMGAFLAVGLGIALIYFALRQKIRSFSRKIFGKPELLEALTEIDSAHLESPRSLNACDRLVMPQILRDFPDFDQHLAMGFIRRYLENTMNHHDRFQIHRIAIARYLPTESTKTIVYQAAVCWQENQKTLQKRFDIHYSYIPNTAENTIAANCPNCGGALGYGITVCPYCGSRVTHVMENTWQVTEILET